MRILHQQCSYLAIAAVVALTQSASATSYVQVNLSSDIPGMAANTDANLKNPWGMSFGATSPFWISDQATNVSTLYTGTGAALSLVVSTPPTSGGPPLGPTGQVFNGHSAEFQEGGSAALFIFSTLAGTIDAWNMSNGNTATIVASTPGATYTGLAMANNGTADQLYAANFGAGKIDVFDASFAPVTIPGGFTDPNLPSGYSPYNVQAIGNNLYVEYDQVNPTTHRPQAGAGLGIVDVFSANGALVQRLITGGSLNAPWGVVIAPAGFGDFGGKLLVGNFGNGMINAFDPSNGSFLGTVSSSSGPIVNDGLWALATRTGGPSVNTNGVYFTAGINAEADGLFGVLEAPTPEPGTVAFVLAAFGFFATIRKVRVARQ